MRRFLLITIFFVIVQWPSVIFAQLDSEVTIVLDHITEHAEKYGLSPEDIKSLTLSDGYRSEATGITYLYFQQTINGIPVNNAISGVVINSNGKIHISGHSFIKDIHNKIFQSRGTIMEGKEAVINVADRLDITLEQPVTSGSYINKFSQVYVSKDFQENIIATKVYAERPDGLFSLSWNIEIDDPASPDHWLATIDASSGEILHTHNHTVYCKHVAGKFKHGGQHQPETQSGTSSITSDNNLANAAYLVYKLPIESPSHGEREMASDNIFPQASPWGWHDDNGDGVAYTITRGNNVHAYEDKDDKNASQFVEPDGGTSLSFIFNHNLDAEPVESEDASITNLFYTNNMCHDLFYLLGFTEETGNFQHRNMEKGGKENDYVIAEGMDGESIGNANFTTPSDGNRGRMQMYLFNKAPSLLKIELPEQLSNLGFEIGTAQFGPDISSVDVTGDVVAFKSNSNREETLGCDFVISDLSGKIAMIDRGLCDFSLKAYYAQEAGAIMAIVCNVAGVNGESGEEVVTMAAGERADDVTIPSIFLKKSDCDIIRTTIDNGENMRMSLKDRPIEGPSLLDADFDNGIIIHEYAHGVSLRLTGGPSNTNCMPNYDDDGDGSSDRGEQMGEGWSDFFALALTTRENEQGFEARGIGTYVENESPDGNGVRNFPFSTDMDINPLTYDDIKTQSVPHGVGTVWAAMLWDMYWKFVELYGFDPDWTNTSSGNYRACFLVIEGLKIQPCRPGFVDGRNAILEADNIHYSGANQKLIWEAFAGRGLGLNADQSSSLDQRDGTEDYSIPPLLIEELKIEKTVSNFVDPGGILDVDVKVLNHIPSMQSEVVVTYELPDGLSYINGSSSIAPEIGDNVLFFEIGDMAYLEESAFTFQLTSDPDIISTTLFLDDVESGMNGWSTDSRKGTMPWNMVNTKSLSGQMSWYVAETDSEEVDQRLVTPPLRVTGNNPVLRFWHQFNIVSGANGGFLEISSDGGDSWQEVNDKMILRNQYPGELDFFTFAIPSLKGFSGSSKGKWVDSYIDLSEYKNNDLVVRFRFGNEGTLVSEGNNPGWYIDEIELVDIRYYTSNVCVSSNEDPSSRCSIEAHTVVKTSSTTSVSDEDRIASFKVYPNPASGSVYIQIQDLQQGAQLQIISMEGKVQKTMNISSSHGLEEINLKGIPSGMYLFRLNEGNRISTRRVQIID